MNIRFDGQVAFITGASGGIGAAMARGFAQSGADVVLHYRNNREAVEAIQQEIEDMGQKAMIVQADVGDFGQIQQMVEEAGEWQGHLDILINNAGTLFERDLIHETPDERYQRIMDVNVGSVFQVCKQVIPLMLKNARGTIINITSVSARRGGGGGSVLYGASKAAISTFTRGLAKELAQKGIRVNAIAPGLIDTALHDQYTPKDRLQAGIQMIPMKRAGQPEECVGAALFLASEELASYITGEIIEVNGGLLMA